MKLKISHIIMEVSGKNLDLSNLENRITFQKTIYLLKELGAIKDKFDFGWYIFGPYSSYVTQLGFDLVERKTDKELNISDDFYIRVKKFQEIESIGKGDMKWLELLASMHYLLKNNRFDKNKLFDELVKHQPYFENKYMLELAFSTITSNFVI